MDPTDKAGLTLLWPAINAGQSTGIVKANASFYSVPCPWVITACSGLYFTYLVCLALPNRLETTLSQTKLSASSLLSAPSSSQNSSPVGLPQGWHPHPCRGPKGHLNTSLARHCPHAVPPQALTILPLPSGGPPHLSILAAVALALTATVPCLPSSRVLLVPHNLLWPFQSVMVNFTCHLDWTMVCLD